MSRTTSKDGTAIAFEKSGNGPAVILVDGALCYRRLGPMGPISREFASGFTVFTYDRRGRGESGDRAPYSVEREVDDIEALIEAAGGSAFVYGASSGAALALAAADRRADAVKLFMKAVGLPRIVVAMMPLMPDWSKLKAVAHTLPYDVAIMGDARSGKPLPAERWAAVAIPTLVGVGGKSPLAMRNAMRALAGVLPDAQLRVLARETHMVKTRAIAPILAGFFSPKFQYRGEQCH
jgi:pimeloyl-ACP methyl ester carboxylesterase